MRERLAGCRDAVRRLLAREGIEVCGDPVDGIFFWIDMCTDTNVLAATWREQGLLLAPGSLFFTDHRPGSWLRFNVSTTLDERVRTLLRRGPAQARA
ncbi:MAG: aminotransferase class I/II-fold pyridoxal phosphate-dependent enzyme [Steroidobacteraceae bacterium]